MSVPIKIKGGNYDYFVTFPCANGVLLTIELKDKEGRHLDFTKFELLPAVWKKWGTWLMLAKQFFTELR